MLCELQSARAVQGQRRRLYTGLYHSTRAEVGTHKVCTCTFNRSQKVISASSQQSNCFYSRCSQESINSNKKSKIHNQKEFTVSSGKHKRQGQVLTVTHFGRDRKYKYTAYGCFNFLSCIVYHFFKYLRRLNYTI